jgi:hypothetical protein
MNYLIRDHDRHTRASVQRAAGEHFRRPLMCFNIPPLHKIDDECRPGSLPDTTGTLIPNATMSGSLRAKTSPPTHNTTPPPRQVSWDQWIGIGAEVRFPRHRASLTRIAVSGGLLYDGMLTARVQRVAVCRQS